MKLLALLTDGFGAQGGIARYNSDLLTALAASTAVREVVAVPRFGAAKPSPPQGVLQLRSRPGRLRWSLDALTFAASRQFDVIFCGHINAVPLAASVSRMSGKPLWLQVHGIEAWHPRGGLIRCATECATLVTAVSRYTRCRLLEWANIDPARVRVLPNTVGETFERRHRRADLMARHQLIGCKVILTVGRLASGERYKGQDRIIRALPRISAARPEAVYLVVGTGDDRVRLEALARDVGVLDRVRFAGEVIGADLPDYFALADVFAMPSTGEGFGIVFLEAARSGLPVIGGNRDGSLDALADGKIGRLIDPGDENKIADAIVSALSGEIPTDPGAVERFAFNHFSAHVDELVRRIA